jgi:hypothetical protein
VAQQKAMHGAVEVARAELGFCQHVADKAAAAALRERQAAPLAVLAAGCSTWMGWANHSAAVCTVAAGQRVSSTASHISHQLRDGAAVTEPPAVSHSRLSPFGAPFCRLAWRSSQLVTVSGAAIGQQPVESQGVTGHSQQGACAPDDRRRACAGEPAGGR